MLARVVTALIGIPIVLAACFWTNSVGLMVLLVLVALLAVGEAWPLVDRWVPTGAKLLASPGLVLIWVIAPLLCVLAIYDMGNKGVLTSFNPRSPVLLVLLPLWAGDSAAIFAGRAFGKHPMAPSISPKKTWEGAFANLVFCVLVAWGTGVWVGIEPLYGVLIGLSAGILGQAGDLFESWLKRKAEVKDSGNLLPGHGGILDRIDSLLFTAVPTTLVYWIATR